MGLINNEQAEAILLELSKYGRVGIFNNDAMISVVDVERVIRSCVYAPSVTEQCRLDELKQMRERIDKMLKDAEYAEEMKFQV